MKLPPLQSLRAFEAVARLCSVSRAADELCVSQSAVSQHIRKLEDWLGEPLFVRSGRGIRLTEAGELYKGKVSEGFQTIHAGTEMLRTRNGSQVVRVSCLPAFATSWLMPQLHDFWARHPDVQLSIQHAQSTGTLDPTAVDIAVREESACQFPDFVAMPVLESVFLPCASPICLQQVGYHDLSDLPKLPLLHIVDRTTWRDWLLSARASGQEVGLGLAEAGMLYPNGLHALSACLAGEGVALLPRAVVQVQLRAKTLVALSDLIIHEGGTYSILTPRSRPISRGALVFAQWMQSLPAALKQVPPRH